MGKITPATVKEMVAELFRNHHGCKETGHQLWLCDDEFKILHRPDYRWTKKKLQPRSWHYAVNITPTHLRDGLTAKEWDYVGEHGCLLALKIICDPAHEKEKVWNG